MHVVSCKTDPGDTLLYMPQKHEIYGNFFYGTVFESFHGKIYKEYFSGNEEWSEFQTGTMLHNHLSIS